MEKTHPYISGPSNVAIAGNKDASPKAIQLAYNDLKDDKEFQNSLALSNFAFDQNIKASADIAKGRIVGGVLTSAANAVFEDIFSPTKSKPKEV